MVNYQQAQKTEIEACTREKTKSQCKQIKITADISMETLNSRRAWSEVFWALNENYFSPRILYPTKLSFKIERQ
jgi:hypothetical protein